MSAIRLLLPGPLGQRTGGYRYDERIVAGLVAAGRDATLEPLGGRFPVPDAAARRALAAALAAAGGDRVVLDHLAAAALDPATDDAPLLLVHHLFADDPDLDDAARAHLVDAERRALAACRGAVATSPFTARRLAEAGLARGRIRAVEPGVERGPAAPPPAAGDGPVRLLCLGALTPRKGHDVLLEALARLGGRAWRCRIVGSAARAPDWAASLAERARRLGLGEKVDWVGECDQHALAAEWARADVLVVPSRFEGYGMVVAEALCQGRPVVATTGGALADTLPAGCGWSLPPDDAPALAEALAECIADPALRTERARAAAAAGAALPDWPRQAAAFERAVDALAAATP